MAFGIIPIEEGWGGKQTGPISQAAAALDTSANVAAAGTGNSATTVQRVARAAAASPQLRRGRPASRRIFWD